MRLDVQSSYLSQLYDQRLSWYLNCHRACNKSNTTGTTNGVETADPSGAREFTPVFGGIHIAQSLVLCVVFCISLFVILSFCFRHWIVCPSSMFGFWLYLWYLQTLYVLINSKLNGTEVSLYCIVKIIFILFILQYLKLKLNHFRLMH